MRRIQLTRNFYLDEFTRSATAVRNGIDMEPSDEVVVNLTALCVHVLQPLRDQLGPVHISSGYRPPALNRLVGGSPKSSHIDGNAVDFTVEGHTPLAVCQWIAQSHLTYDQLIHEFGRWTHISFSRRFTALRFSRLTSYKQHRTLGKPRTVYVTGLKDIAEIVDRMKIA